MNIPIFHNKVNSLLFSIQFFVSQLQFILLFFVCCSLFFIQFFKVKLNSIRNDIFFFLFLFISFCSTEHVTDELFSSLVTRVLWMSGDEVTQLDSGSVLNCLCF